MDREKEWLTDVDVHLAKGLMILKASVKAQSKDVSRLDLAYNGK